MNFLRLLDSVYWLVGVIGVAGYVVLRIVEALVVLAIGLL